MNNAEPHINMDTTYFLSADGHREDPDRFGQLDSSNGSVNQKPTVLNLTTKHVIKINIWIRYG